MGVSGAALGVGGGEYSVNEDKCADDFSTEAVALGVTVCDRVCATAE